MTKKIVVLSILVTGLLACNKEGKKTSITSPAKTEMNSDAEQTVKVVEVKPAISDSAGIFTQKFILEKGQTYPLVTKTKNKQTLTDPTGKSVSVNSENIDEMALTVDSIEGETYHISINLLGKKNMESAEGKTVVVDTRGAAPKEENLKMMWSVNKALIGNTLKMKMKKNGEVLSITGFDDIYKKVNEVVENKIKDTKQKEAFIEGFKRSFGEEALKQQFSKNLLVIPQKGVKIGEKWTETENATPDGKVKMTTNLVLKSVDHDVAVISVSGGIPKKSDKQSNEGYTHSISSELSQNGTMTLDRKTGWIKNQSITINMTQTENISDGKQTQSMKSVGTSTVLVNP